MRLAFDDFLLETFAEIEHSHYVAAVYAGWVMLTNAEGHEAVQGELWGSYRFELFKLHNSSMAVSKTKFSQLLKQCERGIANCRIDPILNLKATERHKLARELVVQVTKVLLKDQLKTQDQLIKRQNNAHH